MPAISISYPIGQGIVLAQIMQCPFQKYIYIFIANQRNKMERLQPSNIYNHLRSPGPSSLDGYRKSSKYLEALVQYSCIILPYASSTRRGQTDCKQSDHWKNIAVTFPALGQHLTFKHFSQHVKQNWGSSGHLVFYFRFPQCMIH
jgi:hypothetical protein